MDKYSKLKAKHERQVNDFPMGFAFSDKQFTEAKEKLGVINNNELLGLSNGGFIKKTDNNAYTILLLEMNKEIDEAMKDDEYLYQGFLYELANHEYGITYAPESTLDCFSLTIDEVNADDRLLRIFKEARAKYLDGFEY